MYSLARVARSKGARACEQICTLFISFNYLYVLFRAHACTAWRAWHVAKAVACVCACTHSIRSLFCVRYFACTAWRAWHVAKAVACVCACTYSIRSLFSVHYFACTAWRAWHAAKAVACWSWASVWPSPPRRSSKPTWKNTSSSSATAASSRDSKNGPNNKRTR